MKIQTVVKFQGPGVDITQLKIQIVAKSQGPDTVEFTGFLNNKFRVKAVAGDNLVRDMYLMTTMMMLIIMLMEIMIIMLTNIMRIQKITLSDDIMLNI